MVEAVELAAAQEQRATQQRLASRNWLRVAFQGSRAIGMMRMASSGAASSKGGGGGRRKSMAPGGRGGRRKSMALSGGIVPGAGRPPRRHRAAEYQCVVVDGDAHAVVPLAEQREPLSGRVLCVRGK